jgi:crotonobetainyl-CoA:carnitine CoA-transferase CaiB-like acyl-CoA transferase
VCWQDLLLVCFFAELGAEVIKFENVLTDGDVTRTWRLPQEGKNAVSAYFSSINWGKKHFLVNYNLSKDLENVISEIQNADIVICNFKKGLAERFGLDYESLSKINPQLIYAQLDGFENDNHRVAFDVVLQAECGYMSMNGEQNSEPLKMPLAFMDILAAHQMKEGILVALINRFKTNKGSYVNCSLEKSAIASLANQASNYLMSNQIPQRIGSLHPNIAPYGEVFKTKDEQNIVLAIGSDKQFENFCNVLNLELYKDEKFKENKNRVIHRTELYTILNVYIQKIEGEELLEKCHHLQIPVGKVKDLKQVFETTTAQKMILEEKQNETLTKRVSTVAFEIKN